MSRSEKTEEEKKTSSSRLRAVLFILWEQDAEGHPWFEQYYEAKMGVIIEHFKGKINKT